MGAALQGADDHRGRWLTVPRTVAFVCHGESVLMIKRRQDSRIYPGCYNGVGGHLERDEDPASGVLREISEETGLEVSQLRLRAIYNIDPGTQPGVLLFVFTCACDSPVTPGPTQEGELQWVSREDLQSLPLVEDLPQMLPLILDMADDAAPLFVHSSYDRNDKLQLRISQVGTDVGQFQ
ncbi:MAG: NUDIX domain-containing protein [Anaerolineaceae bacterium]|nr:NUDIX domain-containing protein [Anaerolineaceae bacterium]